MPRAPRGIAAADADEEAKPKQEEKKQKNKSSPEALLGSRVMKGRRVPAAHSSPRRGLPSRLHLAWFPHSFPPQNWFRCCSPVALHNRCRGCTDANPTPKHPGGGGGGGGKGYSSTEQREQRTPKKPQARTGQHHPQLETPSPGEEGGGSPPEVSHMLSSVRCLSISKLAV